MLLSLMLLDLEREPASQDALQSPCIRKTAQRPTAGSAKKEMPSKAQKAAMILPGHVSGVLSPYPTVDRVI